MRYIGSFLPSRPHPASLPTWFPPDTDALVVIDEIQKVPALLDEVHRQIEHFNKRFLLTGASVRKLRRNGANLLAGRALVYESLKTAPM